MCKTEDNKSCFFCTTPFQIMTAIILVRQLNLTADLYIVPQFKTARKVAQSIKNEKVFDNVVYVDTAKFEGYKQSRNKIGLYLGIVKNYIRVNKITESYFLKDERYASIFVSSKANVGRLTILYLYKMHKLPLIHYFDDGESSYDNRSIIDASKCDKLIRSILFGKNVLKIQAEDSFLYSKKLYESLNPNSSLIINQIHLPRECDINLLKRCFSIDPEKLIKEPVIILDVIKNENLETNEVVRLSSVYQSIIDVFGTSNVIIKRHPRDKSEMRKNIKYYSDNSVPFELLCCDDSANDKVLITAGSTAVVLPKLLFGREPYVIVLNRMVKTKLSKKVESERYYKECMNLYFKRKFYMPKSNEELIKLLKDIYASLEHLES